MKTILKLLLAAFVLSLVPTTYICAQGHIETPAERKARLEREAREAEAKAIKEKEKLQKELEERDAKEKNPARGREPGLSCPHLWQTPSHPTPSSLSLFSGR